MSISPGCSSGICDDAVLREQAGQKRFLRQIRPLPGLLQEQRGRHVSSPSFLNPPSPPPSFGVGFSSALHPQEIGFIDLPRIKSHTGHLSMCANPVRKCPCCVRTSPSPCLWFLCVFLCVCERSIRLHPSLPPPSDPHPTMQRMTSQIRPCALRAEDTRSTCWAGD